MQSPADFHDTLIDLIVSTSVITVFVKKDQSVIAVFVKKRSMQCSVLNHTTKHFCDNSVECHNADTLREPSVSFTAPRPHVTDLTNGNCVSS